MTRRALRLTMASCTTRCNHKSRPTGGDAQAPDPQEPELPFYSKHIYLGTRHGGIIQSFDGEPTKESNVDFLIIKDTDKRPIDRWIEVKRLLRNLHLTIPVSPLVYTEKEILDRIAIKDFFIREILERGEVLYG